MEKKDICFVRARGRGNPNNDYVFQGLLQSGFEVEMPYIGNMLLPRCIREVWFRCNFPFKSIWYNKKIKKQNARVFIVKDPLIIADFLLWMRKCHKDARIILDYDNRVRESNNFSSISNDVIEKWSYDEDDCRTYGLRLKPPAFLDIVRIKEKRSPEYDVFFVGRDKGRIDYILNLEKQFNGMGLKTKFIICPDRSFMKNKDHRYQNYVPFEEYKQYEEESRAILNVMPPDQKSITQREIESAVNGVKCITTNQAIRNFVLYDDSRYFVLKDNNLGEIEKFLSSDYKTVSEVEIEPLMLVRVIEHMLNSN